MKYVPDKAAIKRISLSAPYIKAGEKESRNAVRNRIVLDRFSLADTWMFAERGTRGAVIKMEGTPNNNVATFRNARECCRDSPGFSSI